MPLPPPANREQLCRDLCWAINSKALINCGPTIAPVATVEIDVNHLSHFFSGGPPRRVGRYFEKLVLYWLTHVRKVNVITHAMPIRSGKTTLGEIDFLFRDENDQLNHLEVAVKFYLYQPDHPVDGSHFVGPNRQDTFERKMDRIFTHQLPLSRTHVADVQVRNAIVKGRIFYPNDCALPTHYPNRLANDHLRGGVFHQQELNDTERFSGAMFCFSTKPFWLSDQTTDPDDIRVLDLAEFTEKVEHRFASDPTPVLATRLIHRDGAMIEAERFFVLSR
ncbi:DUF1853 family protein [Rubripirellula reticaptiva]|uniref:DUF1853 domain-containing protein n=1 Tax=Rubripirellula reticaptiva TaxID=2528013 RepID=A0A5C6EU17_9BACT|nr:DUF1853 family protein [Rubripirellula reticaptiva]TWU51800.1 hypothetical protein Poly59_33950 [Rubripirellula reticaptiva]